MLFAAHSGHFGIVDCHIVITWNPRNLHHWCFCRMVRPVLYPGVFPVGVVDWYDLYARNSGLAAGPRRQWRGQEITSATQREVSENDVNWAKGRWTPIIIVSDLFQEDSHRLGIPTNDAKRTEVRESTTESAAARTDPRFCFETCGHLDGTDVLPAVHRNQRHGVLHGDHFPVGGQHLGRQICDYHHRRRPVRLYCRVSIHGVYTVPDASTFLS